MDDSIELANNSLINLDSDIFSPSTDTIVISRALQYLCQGINEGTRNIKLQYWIEQANGIAFNYNCSTSTLTVREIAAR